MVRKFEITDKKRLDYGLSYDGYYLNDLGDAQLLTTKGHEFMYCWEIKPSK